jgi:hypothetical protein
LHAQPIGAKRRAIGGRASAIAAGSTPQPRARLHESGAPTPAPAYNAAFSRTSLRIECIGAP